MNLTTIPQARNAVKSARRIFIKVRFGLSEDNVKIPKIEALYFLSNFNDTVTPKEQEMYTDTFGYVDGNGDVYLG